MPSTIEISPSTVSVQIRNGGACKRVVTVNKTGVAFVGYACKCPEWVSSKPNSLALLPPDIPSQDVELTITVPRKAGYGVRDLLVLFVAEGDDKDDITDVNIHVDVPMPWLRRYWWVVLVILIIAIIVVALLVNSSILETSRPNLTPLATMIAAIPARISPASVSAVGVEPIAGTVLEYGNVVLNPSSDTRYVRSSFAPYSAVLPRDLASTSKQLKPITFLRQGIV